MKAILALCLLLTGAVAMEAEYFLKRYQLYFANNQSYLVIDLLGYSNATKFWGQLTSVDVAFS
jgi:hypothetical protein